VEQARRQHGTNELPPPEIETIWEKLQGSYMLSLIVAVLTLF
jgi:hypothetical protein